MRKIVLTCGLIAGAILAASMLIALAFQDRIGFDRGVYVGYGAMIVAFVLVPVGVRAYRDRVAGGHVTIGRALAVGLLITLVASACYVATWEVIYYRLAPDFGEKYAAHEIAKAKQAGATDAQIAERTRQMADFNAMYRKPLVNIGFTFLEPLPVGLLFVLVTAGVLGRRRRPAGEVVV